MKKKIPPKDEDPQMYPPDPCADTVENQKMHHKKAVEGGPVYRTEIPRNIPPEIPLK